jgi:hypothetical protein
MKDQSFKAFKRQLFNQLGGDPPKEHLGLIEAQGKGQAFWQFRPWSRVLYWGRDYKNCCEYVKQNVLEALGFVVHKPKKHRYMASKINSDETSSGRRASHRNTRGTGVAPPH